MPCRTDMAPRTAHTSSGYPPDRKERRGCSGQVEPWWDLRVHPALSPRCSWELPVEAQVHCRVRPLCTCEENPDSSVPCCMRLSEPSSPAPEQPDVGQSW